MANDENKVLDMTDTEMQLGIFKALANPARLDILRFLHNGPSCVTLASIKLGVSQSNLSKHLSTLREAGLIDCRGKGAKHCYFICRPSVLGPLLAMMEQQHEYKPCSKPEQHE